ncbi:MAG: thioredoxin domain-containing protein [Thermodesulfobacteriota bacterium]
MTKEPPGDRGGGNRLANEVSAYLRGAEHQPVDWYPWGSGAFEAARELDRPILLDIGARWCHWCHVIDSESYDDLAVARIINENFIAVKVDRDERPDVDRRYQMAVNALTGKGGWPLTAFITPEGKVFFGGTYFPPEASGGLPSFRTVLLKVIDYYRKNRAVVAAESDKIMNALVQMGEYSAAAQEPAIVNVEGFIDRVAEGFDNVNGGFGEAPKFPHFGTVELLIARYFETGDSELLHMVEKTLTKSAKGGMYDQIGGGFHRYCVDAQWIVPHFEKMCYDNAGHLRNYLQAYQVTGEVFMKEVAQGIIGFVCGVLSEPESGGFYASQDSDVDLNDDGDYFTWLKEEAEAALTNEQTRVLSLYYNIYSRGEMKHNPGKNVLFIDMEVDEIAKRLGMDTGVVKSLIESGKKRLFEERSKRPSPYVDKTLFTNWNAFMTSSMLLAFKVLGSEDCRESALKTLDFFLNCCYMEGEGFYHAYSDGSPRMKGLIDDQVHMTAALLDAYEVSGKRSYFDRALELSKIIVRDYFDEKDGGFFDIADCPQDSAMLRNRIKSIQDDPIPSSNAAAVMVFDRLYYLTGDEGYREYASKTLKLLGPVAENYGIHAGSYFLAVHNHLKHPPTVVVSGGSDDPGVMALLRAAWSVYRPHKIVVYIDPAEGVPEGLFSTASEISKMEGTKAVVCAGAACTEPTGDPETLEAAIKEFGV